MGSGTGVQGPEDEPEDPATVSEIQPLQVFPPVPGIPWTCEAAWNGPAPPAGVLKKSNELALKVPLPV